MRILILKVGAMRIKARCFYHAIQVLYTTQHWRFLSTIACRKKTPTNPGQCWLAETQTATNRCSLCLMESLSLVCTVCTNWLLEFSHFIRFLFAVHF